MICSEVNCHYLEHTNNLRRTKRKTSCTNQRMQVHISKILSFLTQKRMKTMHSMCLLMSAKK